jgi:hypothetical protein
MSENNNVPDCLVLKLEEICANTKEIDNTIYILYDKNAHNYVVRGRRKLTTKHNSTTYSFVCEFANDLTDFLQYVICKTAKVNEILYNYDNLSKSSNDITFEFLQECDHPDYEISGYNGENLNRDGLLRKLRMLRNVFNYNY